MLVKKKDELESNPYDTKIKRDALKLLPNEEELYEYFVERKGYVFGVETTIPEPEKKMLYSDATTAVKADQKFLKNKIKNYDKNKFYNARDLGNILGFDFAG